MPASHVAVPVIGLLSVMLGWPLKGRRVPPNRWYGLRVPATLADQAIWYQANAACGDDLVRMGAVLLAIGLALPYLRGLPDVGYVTISLAVLIVGGLRAALRGRRLATRLLRDRRPARPA